MKTDHSVMGRSKEMNKSLVGESGSVECSITLRGGTQLLLFASIGFFLGAGNFQDWFQGDQKNLKSSMSCLISRARVPACGHAERL